MTARDSIDPELLEGLDGFFTASGPRGVAGIPDISERRAVFADMMAAAAPDGPPQDGVETEDRTVPGPPGGPSVRVRIYRPGGAAEVLPGLFYVHGGGLTIGSIETEDPIARALAAQVGCAVVSVEYRLAPETPHPGPVEDCYAALAWLADEAGSLGIDPARLAVYGGSAGGLLAAAVALMARDRRGPALVLQMLIYPMLDDRADTPSCREIHDIGIWDGWMHREGFEALLGDRAGTDVVDAYAAPVRATDLSGLPPTFIDVGQLDALRDEDVAYAVELMRAGVPTELHVYPGAHHGFEIFSPDADVSRRAVDQRLGFLRRHLHPERAAVA
jgi:acetyl esterase/lipase